MSELLERYQGCLLGLAIGDAVGTAVEFSAKDSFPPITDMVGGGPFHLQAGQWTDDTSMALCLAESLIARQGFDAKDQMNRYMNWWQWGYLSATGHCFDIGTTVAHALQKYANDGDPFAGSSHPRTAGNGSLMRLAPVVLWYFPDELLALEYAEASSRTTHAAPEALACCRLFAQMLMNALSGKSKRETLTAIPQLPEQENLRRIAEGNYLKKTRAEIFGTGYCVQSLEAALWCFAQGKNFKETILLATNLGDDADTTAAIAGQLAGAYYGINGIPQQWQEKLWQYGDIDTLARKLLAK
ncbi:ADP-ribosylglycohydrolase [Kosakonia radicincitans DSM 16656]|uniref:ADP-ribosyl-[dinitrogen reductase] hydrolase n=1 Tax=Kosakonia radicincitans TaxID=283686 RepID=A0AAX2EY98_9ENTR|nr:MULTISPECIES: ADP-ribosylglycohydrolase family protein [Kosakonia]MDP9568539.1 ADP-ribosyl-[dinitrogen reductase] hydrolase [Kosakonia oryzae]APG20611.1 ADP-ribosylglycohydrolase [Kosakonia radicincitans]ARD63416.1 ADP-ribosylglycohydrolase [Kosakonia radicincitans DSM 16656]KDE36716.1 ADP-ribosylglycohydrolase [Kosakonia radicincitans UMEnt01/12]MDD7996695.1 ADP-ribosylglycohydrolase family protein [Kosakonia radicincitans]